MAEKPYSAGHGIIEVDARNLSVGSPEFEEFRRQQQEPDWWEAHFPTLDWLEDQAQRARAKNGSALFKPWEDYGWFMQRMAAYRKFLEIAVSGGDAVHAAVYAMELGTLLTEWSIKFRWEANALRGLSTVEGAGRGGRAPRAKSQRVTERQQPLFDAYWRSRNAGGAHETAIDRAVNATRYSRRQALRLLGPLK
jgi:hypothetical protein